MAIDSFDFEDFGALLTRLKDHPPGRKRPLTLSQISRKLGYTSPRLFSMVLKGQRAPSRRLLESLAHLSEWTESQSRFAELLARKAHTPAASPDRHQLDAEIEAIRANRHKPYLLADDAKSVLSDWFFLPLKQLVAARNFREDGAWLSSRLRGKVSPEAALEGLRKLEENGVIVRDSRGQLKVSRKMIRIKTPDSRPSLHVRRAHVQMMQRAVEALTDIPPEKREFLSLTLRMRPEDLLQAAKDVRTFVEDFSSRYFRAESSEVFQLNLQLFAHTAPSENTKDSV